MSTAWVDPGRGEQSACGVGIVASRVQRASHSILTTGIRALRAVEHRGATAADERSGDGSGVMTHIPFELLGIVPGEVAVATLFVSPDRQRRDRALDVMVSTFAMFGMHVLGDRTVPHDPTVLGEAAARRVPHIVQLFLGRPSPVRTDTRFEHRLHDAKQLTRTKLREAGATRDLFFVSLSTSTVVYKALTRAVDLDRFYSDLRNPRYKTRFCVLHRRFSTNTQTSWDKAQPFRVIAHNGEINTITGNRSACYAREQALGLARGELLTHREVSDSGNFNEMVEALKYRSGIPYLDEILGLMIPPAHGDTAFYRFWGRALEPWDGPALVAYSDGNTVGARLDRNGFRPVQWCMTPELFCLGSEAGMFGLDEGEITQKGTLQAGTGVTLDLPSGGVRFDDPGVSRANRGAVFDARTVERDAFVAAMAEHRAKTPSPPWLDRMALFGLTTEELNRVLTPMFKDGKEAIGSMGYTARPAILSELPSSFCDFFYQRFAQVTNPPLDYLRERTVTSLEVFVGPRPNVLDAKELLPVSPALRLPHPVLGMDEIRSLRGLTSAEQNPARLTSFAVDCTFARSEGARGLGAAVERIAAEAGKAAMRGDSVVILTHEGVSRDRVPVPSILALRSVVRELNDKGVRLRCSVVLEAGDIRTTHEVACAIGFGATAVCPRLGMELAEQEGGEGAVAHYMDALCQGLLRIMARMGISVVRSYHSSKLFTAFGLGTKLASTYFSRVENPLGGLEMDGLGAWILRAHALRADAEPDGPLPSVYRLKERARGGGEAHSMTAARAKALHRWLRADDGSEPFEAYRGLGREAHPVSPRHLLELHPAERPARLDDVEDERAILARVGSGAMSFGAISAQSQRDLFVAMDRLGARSNSGEGGENPHYFTQGIHASTKQIASGRFGVTAEYLVTGREIEIKIAQGAKPGEGGQLLGVKVDETIARARFATAGRSLISPPPLHDIYSIEDLKQLIYELKQLHPTAEVAVKLVSGTGIGTVAVGVAKAGANIIHISGGDGGTGAASLSSMQHAGLPWEIGLVETHDELAAQGLRGRVRLRVDGGLASGMDLVVAAALGADEFAFGKLLLVAQGCIMARICEKNRCPTGIATHDPKFLAKYRGKPEDVEKLLLRIAQEVRVLLASLGLTRLQDAVGRRNLLRASDRFHALVDERGLDLAPLLQPARVEITQESTRETEISDLNGRIMADVMPAVDGATFPIRARYPIQSTDRAALTTLCGQLAARAHRSRMATLGDDRPGQALFPPPGSIDLSFEGSAGQGFAAFLVRGLDVTLHGEANDSLCKSMSGGVVVVRRPANSRVRGAEGVIAGNCALYGATGGTLYLEGRAGDRFAVRNSGAVSVAEGSGLHTCEYMTGGEIVILGPLSGNAGAGMTGGVLFIPADQVHNLNGDYVEAHPLDATMLARLRGHLEQHHRRTGSASAASYLERGEDLGQRMRVVTPLGGSPGA